MSKIEIAVLLALCAALASAVGDVIRQRSAHEITDQHVGHLRLFGLSLRDTRWWLGGMMAVLNYSLQAVALIWGPVILVTSLQVTTLLFALPIYARVTRRRITRWEWAWALILAAALTAVIVVGHPDIGQHRASPHTWLILGAVVGPLLAACVVLARKSAGRPVAAVLLAVVAGSSLALFAVLTKGVVEVLHDDGFAAVLRAPEFYPWMPAALAGMIFQQSAFRAGALTASLPTMTVAKPLVAALLGITLLGESLTATGVEAVVLVVGIALVAVATLALARGEAATMVAEAGGDTEGALDTIDTASPDGHTAIAGAGASAPER